MSFNRWSVVSLRAISCTNLLTADQDGFKVISMLKELKKSKLLVLESHCALNNNFYAIINNNCPSISIRGSQYVTGNNGNYYRWP